MRKILVVLLAILCVTGAFAKGSVERKIVVLHSGENPLLPMPITRAKQLTEAEFPGLTVEVRVIDLSSGAPVTMDTMIASGTPPDVYMDSMVRLSRYIDPVFAMELDGKIDLSQYLHTDPLKRNGKTLALPYNGGAQGMCLNLDLLEAAGYEVKDGWTVADFLEMCEKVKAYGVKTGKEVYGTGLFAGNQSGDYLWMQWFAVFGVDLYADDYAESTQDKGGAKVWEFFKMLKDKGYVPADSATIDDDVYALQWSKGMLAAAAFYPSWAPSYIKSAIEQGLIKEGHRYKFVSFPNNAPACTNWSGILGNKNSKFPVETAAFLKHATDMKIMQDQVVATVSIAYRKDIKEKTTDQRGLEIDAIVAKNGLYDLGVTNPWFAEVRAQGFPVLQAVLSGKMTPEQAAIEYTKRVNDIIR